MLSYTSGLNRTVPRLLQNNKEGYTRRKRKAIMEKTKMFPICLGAILLFCQGLTLDISGVNLSEITPFSSE